MQYGDFLFLASDQIVNNAAKMRYMSGGTIERADGDARAGRRHRTRLAARPEHGALFHRRAGLKVVAPSNAYDAKGMLKAAVRDDNPVLIFEHKLLYGSKGARAEPGAVDATSEIPEDDLCRPARQGGCRDRGRRRDDHRVAADAPLLGASGRRGSALRVSPPK